MVALFIELVLWPISTKCFRSDDVDAELTCIPFGLIKHVSFHLFQNKFIRMICTLVYYL